MFVVRIYTYITLPLFVLTLSITPNTAAQVLIAEQTNKQEANNKQVNTHTLTSNNKLNLMLLPLFPENYSETGFFTNELK